MQQQKEHKPQFTKKQPFTLKISSTDRPNRVMSLNRLNYAQDLKRDGTFVAKKDIIEQQLFDHHIVKSNMNIQKQLKKLHATFIYEKVPDFYAYFFMNQLVNASQEKIQDHIFRETQQLKGKRSYFHVIANAIKAREGCIKQLQRCLDNLFNNQEDNITKHVFRQQIIHYRKLTGFVIAHLRSWKQYLKSINPQTEYITYYVKGEDYLIKILEDCQFLFNSFLAKDLKFHYKNDPYIMRPYLESSKENKFYDLFTFDEENKAKYVDDMNFLADQRAKNLESKMNSKNQKIKQIQKIYNYKENPLASRIFIKKIHLLERKNPREDVDQHKQGQQDHKKLSSKKIDNFMEMSSEKRYKFEQLNKKNDKIKKIKDLYKKKAYSQEKLVHTQNIFKGDETNPYEKKLRYTHFNPKKQPFQPQNTDSDFQNLVRKKQLKILDNYAPGSTQKLSRTFKIKDSISESRAKFLSKDQGAQQLEKILSQLQKLSPQKLDTYKLGNSTVRQSNMGISRNNLSQSKISKTSRYVQPMKTTLAHNQQVFVSVRNSVIKQIEKSKAEKDALQKQKREQNERIQQILQNKLNQQSIKMVKSSRVKDVEGRHQLAQSMKSSQIFGYKQEKNNQNSKKLSAIEEQLKKQMQLKWLREVQSELKHRVAVQQMQAQKKIEQNNLNIQLKRVSQQQQRQKRFEQIQREQRAKAQKKIIELTQQRKRQIEQQMKLIIEGQKQKMQKIAVIQKMQIEQQLREAMKQKLLENMKKQKQRFYDDKKKQKQINMMENKYRQQVRDKIEEEYQLGLQMKKNREKQQKMNKLKLIKQKLQDFDHRSKANIDKSKVEAVDQSQTFKKSKISSQIPDISILPKRSPDIQKKKLRQQFQLQLFSFRTPQVYSRVQMQKQGKQTLKNDQDFVNQIKFLKKDYKTKIDDRINNFDQQNIKEGQQSIQKQQSKEQHSQINIKSTKQKQMDDIQQITLSHKKTRKQSITQSQKFTRFSQKQQQIIDHDQIIRNKLGMSPQEYLIYKKKKDVISTKRDIEGWQNKKKQEQQKKMIPKVIEDFKKVNYEHKTQSVRSDKFSQFQQQNSINNAIQISHTQKQIEQTPKQTQIEKKPKKTPKMNKKQQKIDFQNLTANSRVQSIYKKHFMTSQSDSQHSQQHKQAIKYRKSKSPKKQISPNKKHKKIQQVQQQNQQQQPRAQIIEQPIQIKKTLVKIRQVPLDKIREFFDDHFEHMPKNIKKTNIYKKQELIKVLLQTNCFTIMEYIKDSLSLGLAIFVHNQNKAKYRSLNILHLGVYQDSEQDYLDVFVNTTKLAMKKDPCQQVTLSIIYDTQISQQIGFAKKLEHLFDPYGAIFQKKIFNTQFQRKMIIRRPIGQQYKDKIQHFNMGTHQLQIDFFISQKKLSEYDGYQPLGYRVGCYGLAAHYISQKAEEQKLAKLIEKSTQSLQSADKNLGYLSKLSLAMKINTSFRRLQQIKQSEYSDIMSLNLQLINKNRKVISYPPEDVEQPNQVRWLNFQQNILFPFNFYNQTIKISLPQNGQQQQYNCKYLRLTPQKSSSSKSRMYTIKSNAYSTNVHILPCKNNTKYRIFILDSQQYDTLKKPIPLDVYMRVLFANLQKHQISQFQNVWLPQIQTNGKYQMTQFDAILDSFSVIRTNWNFSYTDYLGNSLKVAPSHRDLRVTPPFIFGVINMQIQKVVEGSPIYIQRVTQQNLRCIKKIDKIIKQSD